MNAIVNDLNARWAAIEPVLVVRNEAQYEAAVARVDALIEAGALEATHPLHELVNVLGTVLHAYEETHYPMPPVSGAEMLRFLMAQHHLKQTDLADLGSQGVVSELLSGKRRFTVRHIATLVERFKAPAEVFIPRAQGRVINGKDGSDLQWLEETIYQDGRIQGVAVVGVSRSKRLDYIMVHIVPKKGKKIAEDDIIKLCREAIGNPELDIEVMVVEALPEQTGKPSGAKNRKLHTLTR